VAGTCTDDHYLGTDVECRPSAPGACCDAPEYCLGADSTNYDCPDDLKHGDPGTPTKVCRPECDGCIGDVEEICLGSAGPDQGNGCPANVLFENSLCLAAGNPGEDPLVYTSAGDVQVNAIAAQNGDVCFTITITLDGWLLDGEDETIKAYIGTTKPDSNSGQYTYKYPDQGIQYNSVSGKYELLGVCLPISDADVCSGGEGSPVFIAIHLDVESESGGNTETAWAYNCPGISAASPLTGNRFYNKNGNAMQGWGKYFEWNPCCFAGCDSCGGGGTPNQEGFICDVMCKNESTGETIEPAPITASSISSVTCANVDEVSATLTCVPSANP
jgi:hypothetical protein